MVNQVTFVGFKGDDRPNRSSGIYPCPRAAISRWRNNGGAWTLLETAFTSYFLRVVSWISGRSFLAISTYV